MLVHLDALGHLDPLFLGWALTVHLFVDSLQVLNLWFTPFDSSVA